MSFNSSAHSSNPAAREVLTYLTETNLPASDAIDYLTEQFLDPGLRVYLLNTFAAYKTQLAALQPQTSAVQEQLYGEANGLYNASIEIDSSETMTWIGRGLILLLKGQMDEAISEFQKAANTDLEKENALIQLVLGCQLIHKRSYDKGAEQYQSALNINPALPSYVRLGLAICHYALGDYSRAEEAFKRVLKLSKDELGESDKNVHALLGLATLNMETSRSLLNQIEVETRKVPLSEGEIKLAEERLTKVEQDTQTALRQIEAAYQLDPTNPFTLLLLANHFASSKDWLQSRAFSERALNESGSGYSTNEVRGLVQYSIARSYHCTHQFPQALAAYVQAMQTLPHYGPIALGYAQLMYGLKGETETAIEALEAIIARANKAAVSASNKQNGTSSTLLTNGNTQALEAKAMAAAASNNFEVLRLLGSLYSQPPSAGAVARAAAAAATAATTKPDSKHSSSRHEKEKKKVVGEGIKLPDYEKSFAYLKKCVNLNANSSDLLLEYAEVASKVGEYQEAYLSYSRYLRLITGVKTLEEIELKLRDNDKELSAKIPKEIANNFGAICMKLKKKDANQLSQAQTYFEWILREKSEEEKAQDISAHPITTRYNFALLQGQSGSPASAEQTMQQILSEQPTYTDALMYLGVMAQKSGEMEAAKKAFEQAHQIQADIEKETKAKLEATPAMPLPPTPAASNLPLIGCALGNWYLQRNELDQARKSFDNVIMASQSSQRKDDYAKLSLGNLTMLTQLRKIRAIQLKFPPGHPKVEEEMANAKISWKEVSAFFLNVLSNDPKNVYAANGLACVLASQGRYLEAKDIFTQIRDIIGVPSSTDAEVEMPIVWCNLGHIFVTQGSYVSAIKMYQMCRNVQDTRALTKVQVLTYLARAYYLGDQFVESKQVLQEALLVKPNSRPLRYNLALLREAFAIDIFQKHPTMRTLADVTLALQELQTAVEEFKQLKNEPDDKNDQSLFGHIGEKAGRHADFCVMTIQNSDPHVKYAKEQEDKQAILLAEARETQAALEAEARAKAEKAEADARAEAEANEAAALAKKQYLENISVNWETVKSEENVKKERAQVRQMDDDGETAYVPGEVGSGSGAVQDYLEKKKAQARERQSKKQSASHKKPRVKRERETTADSGSDEEGSTQPERKKKKKEKKPRGRSKYMAADASPPRERKQAPIAEPDSPSKLDVDAELAARRGKMEKLVKNEKSGGRRLTKASTDSEEEDGGGDDDAKMEDVDEGETAGGDDTQVDQEDGGDQPDDEDEDGQQKKKKSKRRTIDEDEEEEGEGGTTAENAMVDV